MKTLLGYRQPAICQKGSMHHFHDREKRSKVMDMTSPANIPPLLPCRVFHLNLLWSTYRCFRRQCRAHRETPVDPHCWVLHLTSWRSCFQDIDKLLGHPMWRCGFATFKSRTIYIRIAELRKHYWRRFSIFLCGFPRCPESEQIVVRSKAGDRDPLASSVFSSRKDWSCHKAMHDLHVKCSFYGEEENGCRRLSSRKDNMKDHGHRTHHKKWSTT